MVNPGKVIKGRKSKRQTLHNKHKIERKVREHHRKQRRDKSATRRSTRRRTRAFRTAGRSRRRCSSRRWTLAIPPTRLRCDPPRAPPRRSQELQRERRVADQGARGSQARAHRAEEAGARAAEGDAADQAAAARRATPQGELRPAAGRAVRGRCRPHRPRRARDPAACRCAELESALIDCGKLPVRLSPSAPHRAPAVPAAAALRPPASVRRCAGAPSQQGGPGAARQRGGAPRRAAHEPAHDRLQLPRRRRARRPTRTPRPPTRRASTRSGRARRPRAAALAAGRRAADGRHRRLRPGGQARRAAPPRARAGARAARAAAPAGGAAAARGRDGRVNDVLLRKVAPASLPQPEALVGEVLERCERRALLKHFQLADFKSDAAFLRNYAAKQSEAGGEAAAGARQTAIEVLRHWSAGEMRFCATPGEAGEETAALTMAGPPDAWGRRPTRARWRWRRRARRRRARRRREEDWSDGSRSLLLGKRAVLKSFSRTALWASLVAALVAASDVLVHEPPPREVRSRPHVRSEVDGLVGHGGRDLLKDHVAAAAVRRRVIHGERAAAVAAERGRAVGARGVVTVVAEAADGERGRRAVRQAGARARRGAHVGVLEGAVVARARRRGRRRRRRRRHLDLQDDVGVGAVGLAVVARVRAARVGLERRLGRGAARAGCSSRVAWRLDRVAEAGAGSRTRRERQRRARLRRFLVRDGRRLRAGAVVVDPAA